MRAELPTAVLWDMDGTLIDSQPIWIRSQTALVTEFGGTWTYSDGLTLVGVSMDQVARALQDAGVQLGGGELIQRVIDRVITSLKTAVPWLPGGLELVTALGLSGVPQAIVTSAPAAVAHTIVEMLPPGTIGAIVADDHVSSSKPHPEPYLTAAHALGIPPSDCIAVEDSHAGLAAAIAAGCIAVGVPRDVALDVPGCWTKLESLVGVGVQDLAAIARSGNLRG